MNQTLLESRKKDPRLGHTCEVCGKSLGKGDSITADIKQTGTVKSEFGVEYMTFEKDGPLHYFCKDHKQPVKTTYLDGSTKFS